MSAETIPSEVVGPRSKGVTCVGCPALRERWWEEYLDNDERDSGTNYKCGAADDRLIAGPYGHPSVTTPDWCPALADRSTRPAEPAAPVAEAGDGEVVAWEARFAEAVEIAQDKFAWKAPLEVVELQSDLLALLRDYASTLEAERARADAAEQRAADALARAEKALETARVDDRDRLFELFESQGAWTAAKILRGMGAMLPADRARLRAAREAQPATDGGDNG